MRGKIIPNIKAIPSDHPHGRQLGLLEREAERRTLAALQKQRRELFRGITRANVWDIMTRLRSPEITEQLRMVLEDSVLRPAAEKGGDIGQEKVEKEVFGVS